MSQYPGDKLEIVPQSRGYSVKYTYITNIIMNDLLRNRSNCE